MWTSLGCPHGNTFVPMIYEAGSKDMDCHVFDQWSISHMIWGFMLGRLCSAPRSVAAWKIGLLFVSWELWENVIEVAFSTYAPGEYHGDSLINSVFDMLPSMSGVWLGRHMPQAWPLIAVAEAWATRSGFGIHSVFLGHQGSICDVRTDPVGCGTAYALRLLLLPVVGCSIEGWFWRAWSKRGAARAEEGDSSAETTPELSPSAHPVFGTPDLKRRPAPTIKPMKL